MGRGLTPLLSRCRLAASCKDPYLSRLADPATRGLKRSSGDGHWRRNGRRRLLDPPAFRSATSLWLPGATDAFLWPLLAILAGEAVAFLVPRSGTVAVLASWLSAAPLLMIHTMILPGLFVGLNLRMTAVLKVPVVLIAGAGADGRASRGRPGTGGVMGCDQVNRGNRLSMRPAHLRLTEACRRSDDTEPIWGEPPDVPSLGCSWCYRTQTTEIVRSRCLGNPQQRPLPSMVASFRTHASASDPLQHHRFHIRQHRSRRARTPNALRWEHRPCHRHAPSAWTLPRFDRAGRRRRPAPRPLRRTVRRLTAFAGNG